MSTSNLTETEVKISVEHLQPEALLRLLQANALTESIPRRFEANLVYDTADQRIRGARMLLRVRQVGEETILTWKGPPVAGPHKSRPEIETSVGSLDAFGQILHHLGYHVVFRYEKYRTEFTDASRQGTVTFDETPIGNFVELEGEAQWIDRTASQLGFQPSAYILDSYARLYQAYCAKNGIEATHMTFASYTK